MKTLFTSLLLKLIPIILSNSSGIVIDALHNLVEDLRAKAASTSNPFDDLLVDFIAGILDGIPRE